MDQVKNFAISIVQVAPSPATSGTSLTVSTGQGALFPSGSFDLTMWPPNVQPNSFNAEIARCSISGDVATLTRHQYGTTAQAVGVGWQVAQNVTAQLLTSGGGTVASVVAGTNVTVNNTDPANPIVSASGGLNGVGQLGIYISISDGVLNPTQAATCPFQHTTAGESGPMNTVAASIACYIPTPGPSL